MRALADKLSTTCDYNLICLQEVWVYEDFLSIQAKVRHYLPYSHFYFGGFLGSGLAVFSRWPIISTSNYPFRLNGRPCAVWRGDWYAGKGVATALIRHDTGNLIEVFTTHVRPTPVAVHTYSSMRSMGRGKIRISAIELPRRGIWQTSFGVPSIEDVS